MTGLFEQTGMQVLSKVGNMDEAKLVDKYAFMIALYSFGLNICCVSECK